MNKEELDKWVEDSHYYEHDECVVLLRQLQAKIENLKRINHHEHIVAENALKKIEELKDEVAEWKMSYENCHRMCSGYGMN